jgi:hypothetical protein
MFGLEICIGTVRSIYSSYKACIRVGVRVGGVVARLYHGSSLVGSLCDFICLYARMQWRLFQQTTFNTASRYKIDHWK